MNSTERLEVAHLMIKEAVQVQNLVRLKGLTKSVGVSRPGMKVQRGVLSSRAALFDGPARIPGDVITTGGGKLDGRFLPVKKTVRRSTYTPEFQTANPDLFENAGNRGMQITRPTLKTQEMLDAEDALRNDNKRRVIRKTPRELEW